MARKSKRAELVVPIQIEEQTAKTWLAAGTITVRYLGNENTYYTDTFGIEFYCKNYPQQ